MGHMVAKDVYGALGDKIDGLTVRTPQTEAFHAMLRELYSPEDAELIVKMPFTLARVERIAKLAGMDPAEVEPQLARLADKGLVVDLNLGGTCHHMPTPFVIGIFEFTMMRMRSSDPNIGKLSKLFVEYRRGRCLLRRQLQEWRAGVGRTGRAAPRAHRGATVSARATTRGTGAADAIGAAENSTGSSDGARRWHDGHEFRAGRRVARTPGGTIRGGLGSVAGARRSGPGPDGPVHAPQAAGAGRP